MQKNYMEIIVHLQMYVPYNYLLYISTSGGLISVANDHIDWQSVSDVNLQSNFGYKERSRAAYVMKRCDWSINSQTMHTHSPTQCPLSAHHSVLVGQRPLPQHTIYFYQPLSTYVHNYEIGRKPAIADDIYHYLE